MLVLELVTDSLRRIGVIAEAEDPSAEQGQDATTRLNDIMFKYAEVGADIGWNRKATTADTVVLSDGLLLGIKATLGKSLAPDYGVEVSAEVLKDAEEFNTMMLRLALQRQFTQQRNTSYPNGCVGNFDIITGALR